MGTAGSELEHARDTRDWRHCNGSGTDAGSQGIGGNIAGEGWRREMNRMNMRPPPPPLPFYKTVRATERSLEVQWAAGCQILPALGSICKSKKKKIDLGKLN